VSEFERIGGEEKFVGRIGTVRVDRFRHADGTVVEREVMDHPGAVGIVARDDLHVWLVRQPREATGEPGLLEIPAGRLDVPGEAPVDAARRELAEEIGKAARSWEPIVSFYSSPGFTNERVHLFLATGLEEAQAHGGEDERIEIVAWPLDDLDGAIAACQDSKSLIGLLWLRGTVEAPEADLTA
jgi:8-oxo-dGTP pyrophosphatase MutT (NUDIX family)